MGGRRGQLVSRAPRTRRDPDGVHGRRERHRAERSLADTQLALAGSYFREATTRVEDGRQFDALALAARAVTLDPGHDAARSLALNLLLWRSWPRLSLQVKSEAPPLALS